MTATIIRFPVHPKPRLGPADGWMPESLRRVFGTPLRPLDVLGDLPSDSQPPEGGA